MMETINVPKYLQFDSDIRIWECRFCDIYCKAFCKLMDINNPIHLGKLKRFLEIFSPCVDDWCAFLQDCEDEKQELMNLLFYRITYVYRNGLFISSATAFHFMNMMNDHPRLLQRFTRKKVLKICSLGGGSASDVVALVSVLESLAIKNELDMDIRITIVDADIRWRTTCSVILGLLESLRKGIWKVEFIHADLCEPFEAKTLKAIQDADVVTMVKFLSELKPNGEDLKGLVKVVSDAVRPGSLLFILDFSEDSLILSCGRQTGELAYFHLLYEELCDFHALDVGTLEKFFMLFDRYLSSAIINQCHSIFVRVWLKAILGETESASYKTKMRFPQDREKFDAMQQLSNKERFRKWQGIVSRDMRNQGFTESRIGEIVQQKIKYTDEILIRLTEGINSLQLSRNKLTEKEDWRATNDPSGKNKFSDWENYVIAKEKYADIKYIAYKSLRCDLTKHLKCINTYKNTSLLNRNNH